MTKKRNKSGPSTLTVLLILAAAALGVVGLATYVKLAPADRVADSERRGSAKGAGGPEVQVDRRTSLSMPKPVFDEGGLRFESEPITVPAGEDARIYVVNRFLDSFEVPNSGIRLLSINVLDGLATLSFTEEFLSGRGSLDEAALVEGIRACLGQFPEIERIEIYADGQKVEELGHIELIEPAPVIRPSEWLSPSKPSEGTPPSP
jgi:hypothetical protein